MASAKGKRHLAYEPELLSCICTVCDLGVKEMGGFSGAVDEACPSGEVCPTPRQQLVLESSQLVSGLG